jgi:hypothetical protein
MTRTSRRFAGSLAAVLALTLGACASQPLPTDQLALAEQAIRDAERAGAVEAAPVEMRNAREKLAAAQRAAGEREVVTTTRLAEQAQVDAQLAEATARAAKSSRAVTELEDSLRALQREAQRPAQP